MNAFPVGAGILVISVNKNIAGGPQFCLWLGQGVVPFCSLDDKALLSPCRRGKACIGVRMFFDRTTA